MERHDPDKPVQIPFWQWNMFLEFMAAMERHFLEVEALENRGGLQRELRTVFLQGAAVVDYLDNSGPEFEGPFEDADPGAARTASNPTSPAAREAAPETAFSSQALYATKRYWCIYLSSGRTNYYGTKPGAYTRCHQLAAPANVSCQGVRAGRCP